MKSNVDRTEQFFSSSKSSLYFSNYYHLLPFFHRLKSIKRQVQVDTFDEIHYPVPTTFITERVLSNRIFLRPVFPVIAQHAPRHN